MTENYKNAIEELLTKENIKSSLAEKSERDARNRLVAGAKEAVNTYRETIRSLIPEAQEALTNVVDPWVSELYRSGIYQGVTDFLKREIDLGILQASDPVEYSYPWEAFRVINFYTAPKPVPPRRQGMYSGVHHSHFVNEGRLDEQALGEQVEKFRAESWIAQLGFESVNGLGITRYPKGKPHYASLNLDKPGIHIPSLSLRSERLLDLVNPKVILDFANQVQSGRAWEVIHTSLTKR